MNKFKSEETRLRWVQSLKNASKAKTEERIEREKEYYKNPKLCRECNLAIPYKTRKNIFCSSSCSGVYNNRKRIKKQRYCKNCGNILKKNARNFCSIKCSYSYRRKEAINNWLDGNSENYRNGELPKYVKDYMLELNNYSCQECGWNKINPQTNLVPLQIHHIDGNYKNNNIKNLKILCPSCHSLTPTWGGSNKGNGRKNRKR